MSLCKWNVRVTYWLCASQTVRLQQSLHGEWEAGVLHRLNRLGAMATCFWEWRSAFWANGGMSWRGRVSKGGGMVSAWLCVAFVELKSTRWRLLIFLLFFWHIHTHTCAQMSLADTFLWGSHVFFFFFWCDYSQVEWAQAGTVYDCVFVFVCQWSGIYCYGMMLEGFSLLTYCLHFWAPLLSSKP